jgi:hypothetical protein
LARRPTKVAAIALANKIARIAWAMMARGERYKEPAALAALRVPAASLSDEDDPKRRRRVHCKILPRRRRV